MKPLLSDAIADSHCVARNSHISFHLCRAMCLHEHPLWRVHPRVTDGQIMGPQVLLPLLAFPLSLCRNAIYTPMETGQCTHPERFQRAISVNGHIIFIYAETVGQRTENSSRAVTCRSEPINTAAPRLSHADTHTHMNIYRRT